MTTQTLPMQTLPIQRTIILENELTTAAGLKKMLEGIREDIVVEAVLPSVADSIAWLRSHTEPDVIFSDIVLNDGLCFNIFKQVEISCPVIFCTGFDKYAVEAFKNNGVDYLLKPISPPDLEESFRKLENIRPLFTRLNDLYKDIHRLMEIENVLYPKAVLCYFRDEIIPVLTESIKYISIEDRCVQVYTEEKPYKINKTMDQLMSMLNPYHFFRVDRKYIIHRNAIQSIKKTLDRKLNVMLALPDPPVISVGKDKTSDFKKWLEGRRV